MSTPASSATTKAPGPRGVSPLEHLTRSHAGSEETAANLDDFEQALRSASGRQVAVADAGTAEIPMWARQPLRREAAPPVRPERPAERPRADRSPKPSSAPSRPDRRDDVRAEARRPDDRVTRDDDDRPVNRPDDAADDEVTDEPATVADGEGDKVDTETGDAEAAAADGQGEQASADTEVSAGDMSVLVAPLLTEVVAPTETDTGDGAGQLTTTVATDSDLAVDSADGAATETAGDLDTTTAGPDLQSSSDAPAEGDDQPTLVVDTDAVDGDSEQAATTEDGATDGDARSGNRPTAGADEVIAEDGVGPRAATESTGRTQQTMLRTDVSQPTQTATNKVETGDATSAVTGLERASGRARQAGRLGAEAAANAPRAGEADDADGPDAVWRQVRRALGNLKTRANGDQEMVVRLRPAELGSVTVRISTTNAGMSVALVADSAAAVSQLNQQRHHLLSDLDESGIGGAMVDIGQHDLSGGNGADTSSDESTGRGGNGRSSVPVGAAGQAATRSAAGDNSPRRSTSAIDIDL